MPQTRTTHSEAVSLTADALIEIREDNRCSPPEYRVDEHKFVRGSIELLVGENLNRQTHYGPAQVNSLCTQVFREAEAWS